SNIRSGEACTSPSNSCLGNNLISPLLCTGVIGWSLPLHSFPFVALLLCICLATAGFGLYILLLPHGQSQEMTANILLWRKCWHERSLQISGRIEANVLAKKKCNNPVAVFDRSKHKHAVQNQHCYLCEADL
uniref:Uncharacterized protein n=1 Tax=Dromaius novaehollandiae TaxID=8790 RepID=A0A8C4IW50_DRONO